MSSERLRTVAVWVIVGLVVAPLGALVVRAAADVWRAPAVVPQGFGARGLAYVFSRGAGAGDALVNSVTVAVLATVIALVVGWPAARVLGERRLVRSWPVLFLFALPLLVPGYATGTGLAAWFIRLGLADSRTGLVLAHLVYVLPYVVLLLAPGFGAEVVEREEAAAVLGAGRVRRLAFVTIPAVGPVLATAGLLGFLVSLSQYGTSLAVGGGTPMLPLILVPFVQTDPQVAATLAMLFLVPALAALAVAMTSARRAR